MKNNKDNIATGDTMSPALLPDINALTRTEDSEEKVPAAFCPLHTPIDEILSFSHAANYRAKENVQGTCSQTLWISFFFDGTGNNMDADVETEKHSNIVKLYQAHFEDNFVIGLYRIYIPGIGTYFKGVKDTGGSLLGLGSGAGGDARITWALEQLDKKIQMHISRSNNPSNPITLINVSAFGFSRGAALARAFANRLLKQRCVKDGMFYKIKTGQFPIRFRFMGLFDTVASSGIPMSFNNISVVSVPGGARAMINSRIATKSAPGGSNSLAFDVGAKAGADPSPGPADGHEKYGGELQIPDIVEEVQHFIAAHEIRNSFPVDSISFRNNDGSLRVTDSEKFKETVYPGVHSDVGGSYRPGEGGRDINPASKLGLIPLKHMYDLAISSGVPLLPEMSWGQLNKSDFETSENVADAYNYYCDFLKKKNTDSKIKLDFNCLGGLFNAHMSLYYAWRFQSIRKKFGGEDKIAPNIEKSEKSYLAEKLILDKKISRLRKEINDAARASSPDSFNIEAEDLRLAKTDEMLREKAKLDALPSIGELNQMITMYDQQLLSDAKAIYGCYNPSGAEHSHINSKKFLELRPHYRLLMDAYHDEFIYNTGLTDQKIISFFDNYVHDSLAAFGKDATLPSDPRVIYTGGDYKLKYAFNENPEEHLAYESAKPVDSSVS